MELILRTDKMGIQTLEQDLASCPIYIVNKKIIIIRTKIFFVGEFVSPPERVQLPPTFPLDKQILRQNEEQ